jgi:hypothetical protein
MDHDSRPTGYWYALCMLRANFHWISWLGREGFQLYPYFEYVHTSSTFVHCFTTNQRGRYLQRNSQRCDTTSLHRRSQLVHSEDIDPLFVTFPRAINLLELAVRYLTSSNIVRLIVSIGASSAWTLWHDTINTIRWLITHRYTVL